MEQNISSKVISTGTVQLSSMEDEVKKLELQYAMDQIQHEEFVEKVVALGDAVENAKTIYGDTDDFHNFAVNYSRIGQSEMACMIVELGLRQYPYSVDLLADFLKYGSVTGKSDECEKCYKRLLELPDIKMTWRGYDFTVDYLLEKMKNAVTQEEADDNKRKIDDIIRRYKKRFPKSEDPYLSEAQVASFLGDEDRAVSVLKYAIENMAAPKCCLRYSDIMMEQGNYDEVIKAVQKGVSVSAQEQPGINIPYLFYLSGLAKDAKIHAEGAYENKERIEDAYSDYRVADELFSSNRSTYIKNMKLRIRILELKSGFVYKQ